MIAPDCEVLIVGGGPAGSVLAALLAQSGRRVLLLERDIHPREHVGESLAPSTNLVFDRIGFLSKMEDAGFVHKPGVRWTAPHSAVDKAITLSLAEFVPPGAPQPYTYNVERDALDAMLLRHAHELGAHVLQGVQVTEVLFDAGRAVGVRARLTDGWETEVRAPLVVDATGRRGLIAGQLKLKRMDPDFHQFGLYSWFRDVDPGPPEAAGMLWLHFLGLERAWLWQIPLRGGVWSVGAVTEAGDFRKAGTDEDDYFHSLVRRNRTLRHAMRSARRIRPWRAEGDYSYRIERLSGPGWLLVGDAVRFVDPIFSTGVDVATFSSLHAAETIEAILGGADEAATMAAYERRLSDGTDAYYELISLFYRLQNLFTLFAVRRAYREHIVRVLQGNLYLPETLERARDLIALMREAAARVDEHPTSLMRPGALRAPLTGHA